MRTVSPEFASFVDDIVRLYERRDEVERLRMYPGAVRSGGPSKAEMLVEVLVAVVEQRARARGASPCAGAACGGGRLRRYWARVACIADMYADASPRLSAPKNAS